MKLRQLSMESYLLILCGFAFSATEILWMEKYSTGILHQFSGNETARKLTKMRKMAEQKTSRN